MNPKNRTLTCIVCPRGCTLEVTFNATEIHTVEGNLCPRGYRYAVDECTHPMRTLTTTACTADGGVVAVKTETPIRKENMFVCMAAINALILPLPVHIGDVVLTDPEWGRIVATQNRTSGL